MSADSKDIRQAVIDEVERCVATHPANLDEMGSPYFEAPLVGFAAADNDLFSRYKEIIGAFHWTPDEVLEAAYGPGGAGAAAVICWILPVAEKARASNRVQGRFPSREWARTRQYGEQFNDIVRQAVVDFLVARGSRAAGPMLLPQWSRVEDLGTGWASTWSERHAAYAAGLGTFSLNDGFITPAGIAHRCGSVVTDLAFQPSAQPYAQYRENCLTCRGLECGACIRRCPAGAITLDGHDKDLCERYTYGEPFRELSKKYDARHVGCGLCQTDVPCEDRIPDPRFKIQDET